MEEELDSSGEIPEEIVLSKEQNEALELLKKLAQFLVFGIEGFIHGEDGRAKGPEQRYFIICPTAEDTREELIAFLKKYPELVDFIKGKIDELARDTGHSEEFKENVRKFLEITG